MVNGNEEQGLVDGYVHMVQESRRARDRAGRLVQIQACACDMCFFFFSSRRRHTRLQGDWSSDVCSSDLLETDAGVCVVPPRSAAWIPGGTLHRVSCSGAASGYVVFVEAGAVRPVPGPCQDRKSVV